MSSRWLYRELRKGERTRQMRKRDVIACGIWAAIMIGITGAGLKVAELKDSPGASEALIAESELRDEGTAWAAPIEERSTVKASAPETTETDPRETAEHDPTIWETEAETETEAESETVVWYRNDQTSITEKTGSTWTDEEGEMLQKLAWAEAGGEGTEAMAIIICVVLNRAADPAFPDTIAGVIYDPGQFTPVAAGTFDAAQPNDQTRAALELVAAGWDESCGAEWFCSEGAEGGFHSRLAYMYTFDGIRLYTYSQ